MSESPTVDETPEHVRLAARIALYGERQLLRDVATLVERGYSDEITAALRRVWISVDDDEREAAPERSEPSRARKDPDDDSPAAVIDYARAREELSDVVERRARARLVQIAERERRLERELLDRSRLETERWLADLETWPAGMQRLLRGCIETACSPETLSKRWSELSPDVFEKHRNRDTYSTNPEEQIFASLMVLFAAARGRKSAAVASGYDRRRRYSGADVLERAKTDLCVKLWIWGVRSIDWSMIHVVAEAQRSKRLAALRCRLTEMVPREIKTLRSKLRAGVVVGGKRKGEPYSEATIKQMQKRLRDRVASLETMKAQLTELEAETDAIRAWGLPG